MACLEPCPYADEHDCSRCVGTTADFDAMIRGESFPRTLCGACFDRLRLAWIERGGSPRP
jgi:hypothetical protein